MRAVTLCALLLAACAPAARPTVELTGYAPASAARLKAAGWRTELGRAEVPLEALRVGPVSRADFEPIVAPEYAPAAELELDAAEPVLVVRLDETTRAFPLAHLVERELVLDELEGVPVAVTYCSLCASARAYDRRVAGEALELRVSGLLLEGNALLHDVATESLWRQLDGRCVVGARAGQRLAPLAAFTVSFGALRAAHPGALVMRAPEPGGAPGIARIEPGDVLGGATPSWMEASGERPLELLLRAGGARCAVAGEALTLRDELVVLRDPSSSWPGAPEAVTGSAAAFHARLDGQSLSFEPAPGGARDLETGSRWNRLGEAVSGPLAGRALEPVPQVQAFRFAHGGE